MSAFSVENPHDGKTFENYTRFEWGVEVGVVTTFMLRLFVPHEFDMCIKNSMEILSFFFLLKKIYVSVQKVVCCAHQSNRLGYVSRTNQITALGYESRTNQSVVFV